MKRGKFITLEGGEGVGKSCNLEFIKTYLESQNIPLQVTREPGGTTLGEEIRELLLKRRKGGMAVDTELLLMFAARAEHLANKIIPALEKGEWILCDRFTDATFAYQGGGRNIDKNKIAQLEQWVQADLRPDLTLLLDLDPAIGMQRASKRSSPDRFEQEQLEFFHRVRNTYLERAKAEPKRFRVIDASVPLEQVQQQIEQQLCKTITGNA